VGRLQIVAVIMCFLLTVQDGFHVLSINFSALVQTVKVNDETWHRVRIGPVAGARKADEMRTQLSQAGIENLVMKSP